MQRQNQINLAIGAVAVILVVVLATRWSEAIMQPAGTRHEGGGHGRTGSDLCHRLPDGDHEFTRLLESLKGAMQSHLSATLMRVQENTTEVASASSQIAAADLDPEHTNRGPRPAPFWNKPQPPWSKLHVRPK